MRVPSLRIKVYQQWKSTQVIAVLGCQIKRVAYNRRGSTPIRIHGFKEATRVVIWL